MQVFIEIEQSAFFYRDNKDEIRCILHIWTKCNPKTEIMRIFFNE